MDKFRIISPIDNSIYGEKAYATAHQIEAVLKRSREAGNLWKNTSIGERKSICKAAIDHFQENINELSEELTWMMGRPIRYTPFEIKGGLKERAMHMIEIADEAMRDEIIEDSGAFHRMISRSPVGTVMVLSPWNYPYLTAVNAVIPALLAGNPVILKHADQTALCAERYSEAFNATGLPAGVFQYLHLRHEQVAHIIKDPRIDHVAFTGSVAGGKSIQASLNERFIGLGLELGGKDPAYVRPDADMKFATENLADGVYFNSGQSCCAIERIYVHDSIYDDFIDQFREITLRYNVGNPTDREVTMGPMVRKSAAEKVVRQIHDAKEKGAQGLINENDFPDIGDLPYLAPQILVNVNHEMDIMREESFGPVVGIMKVKSDEEAINLMNDSKYGLTASIWTSDVDKAIGIGRQIETGTFLMNRCDYLDPALAWTGVKDSGRGCTLSANGFDQFTRLKSYHLRLK